jgi:hypothetical protein
MPSIPMQLACGITDGASMGDPVPSIDQLSLGPFKWQIHLVTWGYLGLYNLH